MSDYDLERCGLGMVTTEPEMILLEEPVPSLGHFFRHEMALVESSYIGDGTRIWAFAHVLPQARIGSDCNICDHTFIENDVVIGDRVTIKSGVQLWDGVTLEDDVFVGPGVIFTNDMHPRSPRMPEIAPRYQHAENWRLPTLVCRGVSLGAGAVLLPGITVGQFALVGAGSVVTRDVLPHQRVLGNPARPRGWVCSCAHVLAGDCQCPACGKTFSVNGTTVAERR